MSAEVQVAAPREHDGEEIVVEIDGPQCPDGVSLSVYEGEHQLEEMMELFDADLSEPYSVFTYRHFLENWPHLCILAHDGATLIGGIICKAERHKRGAMRGYIAMLAVRKDYRGQKLGTLVVVEAIKAMARHGCEEVVLETEESNAGALLLYEKIGFVRDKKLPRYYLNGGDAFRLKLWLV